MKLNKEMKVALFFFFFASFYLIMTKQIKTINLFSNIGLNAKSLPQMYGIVMMILSTILFITSLKKQKKNISFNENEMPKIKSCVTLFGRTYSRQPIYLSVCIVLFALYAATYVKLGFVLSGFMYLSLMIMLLTPKDKRSKKMIVFIYLFSFVFVFGLYVFFTRALGMMLPRGILS